MDMPINDAGVELLKGLETFVDHAYPDPYSALGKALRKDGKWGAYLRKAFDLAAYDGLSGTPWTFGYGFTDNVKEGDTITQEAAIERLAHELAGYADTVAEDCTVAPSANELAAMTCLAWNIGLNGFKTSTVLKCHNRGDQLAASRAFGLWNKSAGEVSAGLTRRRAAEAALYLKPADNVVKAVPQPMPQAVQPESSVAKSPIVLATTGATVLSALTQASEMSGYVKTMRENLGDWAAPGFLVLAVTLGGTVIWHRLKQRTGGWA